MVFQINTDYNETGISEDQYINLRKKLQRFENEGERPTEMKEKDSNAIVRGRAGIIMPTKNAFDFVERPESNLGGDDGRSGGANKGKGSHVQLKKIMEGLKKKNRTNFTNKRMQIVKMDV